MNFVYKLITIISVVTFVPGCEFMAVADALSALNSVPGSSSTSNNVICKPVENSESLLTSSVEGIYISEITGQKGYLDAEQGSLRVAMRQSGNRVEGYFGNSGGRIEGTVDGETITFNWYSSLTYGTGEWQIKSSSNNLTGTWKTTREPDGSGEWNLKECQLTFVSVE
jgi:hypothetical protein